MKKTVFFALIFFSLLGIAVLLLGKVELLPATNSVFKVEINNLKIFGYQDNRYCYFLSAEQAKADQSTDYLHTEKVSGTLVSENIKISADKSTVSLYSASFQENVLIELPKQKIKINAPKVNYNFYSHKISLPQKSTANFENENYLIFEKASFDTQSHKISFNNVFWTDTKQNIKAPKATFSTNPSKIIFHQPDWLEQQNTKSESVRIKANQLTFFLDKKNLQLQDNVQIVLQEKKAFSNQGFLNSKEIILLGNAYIIDADKKIQAKKIQIDIENYDMQAFDDIQVTFDIN